MYKHPKRLSPVITLFFSPACSSSAFVSIIKSWLMFHDQKPLLLCAAIATYELTGHDAVHVFGDVFALPFSVSVSLELIVFE